MENSRLLIFLLVSMAIVIFYNQLMQWRHPELAHRTTAGATISPSPAATPSAASQMTPAATDTARGTGAQTATSPSATSPATPAAPARIITIDTRLYRARIVALGGRILSFGLKDYRQTAAANSPPYEIVAGGDRLPIALVMSRDGNISDDGTVAYSTDAPDHIDLTAVAAAPQVVTLTGVTADGIRLEKRFTFSADGYVFEVAGKAAPPSTIKLDSFGLEMSRPLLANEGFHDIPELQAEVHGKLITEAQKALEKGVAPLTGPITFAGFGDRYFLSAFLPTKPSTGILSMDYVGDEADARLMFEGASTVRSAVYMGPKELDALESVNPALKKAIDFGWSGIVALPFLKLLKLFHRIAPNYGLAIILLTIVVRLLTLPMSIKGQRSMMKMQRLQPQIERIREKHKDDQERLNREMVDLYKRNHVNPLGGCLPMVVQLPVFFGLYEALLNAIELRHAPFVGWITDLSAPDCLHVRWIPTIPFTSCHGLPVLVILMTITAFVQQWMSPKQPDPNQQKIMMYMPVAFSLIFVNLPAGLTLYYFASNLLGVAQQFVLNREFKQLPAATAP